MLVLGDSVMWGQGLADQNKFSYLVAQWICEKRNGGFCPAGADVDLHVEAHSGAVLAKATKHSDKKEEQECLQDNVPLRCQGEVPYAYPTIWSQVDLAERFYSRRQIPAETIDLILVDGGINDLGAPKILLPYLGGNIENKAKEYCHPPMISLLEKAHKAFPNAVIVVAGYFPLVSKETPFGIIYQTIHDVFPKVKVASADKKAITQAEADAEPENAVHESAAHGDFFESLPERSKKWKEASDAALQAAVNDFNQTQTGKGANPPAVFAGVEFSDEHAYGASKTYLWQLGPKGSLSFECPNYQGLLGSLLKNLIVLDQQQALRPCTCILAGMGQGGHGIFCMRAGAFHPNTFGAKAYFEAIKTKLEMLRAKGLLKL